VLANLLELELDGKKLRQKFTGKHKIANIVS